MSERKLVIVLDPAHGGREDCAGSSWQGGASPGPNPILEKDLALTLAKAVKERLDSTHEVTLTRDHDTNLSLRERAGKSRELRADLFLSIHFNAASDPRMDGTEAWVANEASAASRALAKAVPQHVARAAGIANRGVRVADLGVLLPWRQHSRTAACLVEVAFLSNPAEAPRLQDPSYLAQIADALAGALQAQAADCTAAGEISQSLGSLGLAGKNTLADSVGRKGRNLEEDVKLVQHLLNSNLPLPAKPLSENGKIDDAIISAIETYQKQILGQKTPDGRVDPKGSVFASLIADKLSLLPHRCQPLAGPSVNVDAAHMNPGFLTPAGVTRNVDLQKIVKKRILDVDPVLRNLRFALVDLTGAGKLAGPQFAGNRETEQGGLGSMAKIACMYAGFQLKFDLEELSRQRGLTDVKDVFAAARKLWDDAQIPDPADTTQLFASAPKVEVQGKLIVVDGKPIEGLAGLSLPDLERIFVKIPGAASGLKLKFIGSEKILVDPSLPGPTPPQESPGVTDYLSRNGEALGEARRLTFAERLFLMIDESDNAAAHSCIEKVGFSYIASSLWQSDLYRPERGGGLWEAATHDKVVGVHWIKPPVPKGSRGTDFVSANACSVAAFFTLLEQGRLVNKESCVAMKHLLDKEKAGLIGGSNTKSYFQDGLQSCTLDRIHSKLGIGDARNDVAIVVRTVRPDPGDRTKDKQIRYVAAGFDDPTGEGEQLHKLIVELDKCILENNGLPISAAC